MLYGEPQVVLVIGAFFFAVMTNPGTFLVRVRCDDNLLSAEMSAECVAEVLRRSLASQWEDDKALVHDLFRSWLLFRVLGGTAIAIVAAFAAGFVLYCLGKLWTSLPDGSLNAALIGSQGIVFLIVLWHIWRGSMARPKPSGRPKRPTAALEARV